MLPVPGDRATQFGSHQQLSFGQDHHPISRRSLLLAVAAGIVGLIVLMMQAGLAVPLNRAAVLFGLVGVALLMLCFGFRASSVRWKANVAIIAEDTLIFVAISLMGAVASYGVAAMTHGWIDESLARMDHAIGFDWNDWYRHVAASRFLQISGMAVYASIFASPAILLCGFAVHGQRSDAREFLAAFWLAAIMSLFLFQFLPTLGPLAYQWHDTISYMPTSGLYQAELIPLLREHHLDSVDLGTLRGLVGPPSFHAASAVLYTLASWRLRRYRIPLTTLNVAMLLSIPVEGTHYAVDVISGALVAITSWCIVHCYVRVASRGATGRR